MPRIAGTSQGDGIQAVLLALHLLEHMAQHRGSVGVTELAQAFETTKSRIHRHLRTLIEGGYVVQEPGGDRYRVSARLIALGEAVSESFDLSAAARPFMYELRDTLGHSVAVSVPEPDGMRILSVLRGGSNVEIGVKPGSLLPYHCSSQGKLTLAFGDAEHRRQVLASTLSAQTPETIADPVRLEAELAAIRARGWASSANEVVIGLNALGAPIFDPFGHFLGTIAIVDSVQFITNEPTRRQIDAVLETAARVCTALGRREAG